MSSVLQGLADIRAQPGLPPVEEWLRDPRRSSVYPLYLAKRIRVPDPEPLTWVLRQVRALPSVKWMLRSTDGPFMDIVVLERVEDRMKWSVARLIFASEALRDDSLDSLSGNIARKEYTHWLSDTPQRPPLPRLREGERRPLPNQR